MRYSRLVLICLIFIFICTSCSSSEQQYQFPLEIEDVEEVILNKESDWNLENTVDEENYSSFTLKNSEGVMLSISSTMYETGNKLGIVWYLP